MPNVQLLAEARYDAFLEKLEQNFQAALDCLEREILQSDKISGRHIARIIYALEICGDKDAILDLAFCLGGYQIGKFEEHLANINILFARNENIHEIIRKIDEYCKLTPDDRKGAFLIRCARMCYNNGQELAALEMIEQAANISELRSDDFVLFFPGVDIVDALRRIATDSRKRRMPDLAVKILNLLVVFNCEHKNWRSAEMLNNEYCQLSKDRNSCLLNKAIIESGSGNIYKAHTFAKLPPDILVRNNVLKFYLSYLLQVADFKKIESIYEIRKPENEDESYCYLEGLWLRRQLDGESPYLEELYNTLYTYEFSDGPGPYLYIFLSSLNYFMCYKNTLSGKKLYVNENYKNWYIVNPDILVDIIIKYIFNGCKIVFIGSSLGAFASLIISSILKSRIDKYYSKICVEIYNICFSPQIAVYPFDSHIEWLTPDYKKFYDRINRFSIFKHYAIKYGDINKIFCPQLAPTTYIYYGTANKCDSYQISIFRDRDKCHLCPLPDYDFHSTITFFYRTNEELVGMRDKFPPKSASWNRFNLLVEYKKKYNYSFNDVVSRIINHAAAFFEITGNAIKTS